MSISYIGASITKLADLHDKIPGSKLSIPYKEFLDAAIKTNIETYHKFKNLLDKQLGSNQLSPEDFFEFANEVIPESSQEDLEQFKNLIMSTHDSIHGGIEDLPSSSVNTMSILQKPWISSTYANYTEDTVKFSASDPLSSDEKFYDSFVEEDSEVTTEETDNGETFIAKTVTYMSILPFGEVIDFIKYKYNEQGKDSDILELIEGEPSYFNHILDEIIHTDLKEIPEIIKHYVIGSNSHGVEDDAEGFDVEIRVKGNDIEIKLIAFYPYKRI